MTIELRLATSAALFTTLPVCNLVKRIGGASGKLNWGKRAYAVFVLCAVPAFSLPAQTVTTLYRFCSQSRCADGEHPQAGLIQPTSGDSYGTTQGGGHCRAPGWGTAFGLFVGLGPFVETQLTFGKAEEPVEILGTDLMGPTSVTFNGTAAVFTAASPSLITTTAAAGACYATSSQLIPPAEGVLC
jgi:hypothetical protein